MLSYQHIYHAGNFADVQKHALLVHVLQRLTASARLLHVLDTHAGRGFYDLGSREAEKTGEHVFGVTPLWAARDSYKSGLIADYLAAVARHNKGAKLARYPGSARIARDLLRPRDRLVAAERHPGEFAELAEAFDDADPQYTDLIHDDGFLGLAEARPEAGRQGLAIIDPSYEIKSEYEALPRQLARHWHGWHRGIAFIWYPILPGSPHRALLQGLQDLGLDNTLISEIRLHKAPKERFRMEGSGIAIVNAPFGETDMLKMSGDIAKALRPACGQVLADAQRLDLIKL